MLYFYLQNKSNQTETMKKVLLTGISGFIGQHCAQQLLSAGYAVKGSVRSLKKADAVRAAVGDSKHLEFCELDLLDDKGWDAAAADCDFLMHVASPFFSKEPKDENKLIKPAVEGTLRALGAAHKAGIQRVVLTSSMVAMLGELKGDAHITDKSWTDVHAKHATAYLKSKTLAEKAAWEFAKDKFELVTVHPGPVFGPPLNDNISGESMTMISNMITGKIPMMFKAAINMSDVRDVAKIHVAALENAAAANTRFVVASETAHPFTEMTTILKSAGYEKVSTKVAPTFMVKFMANFDAEMRGMLPYVGKTYQADVRPTMQTFDWQPMQVKKMVLETAEAVGKILKS